jgi:hypothetical protein
MNFDFESNFATTRYCGRGPTRQPPPSPFYVLPNRCHLRRSCTAVGHPLRHPIPAPPSPPPHGTPKPGPVLPNDSPPRPFQKGSSTRCRPLSSSRYFFPNRIVHDHHRAPSPLLHLVRTGHWRHVGVAGFEATIAAASVSSPPCTSRLQASREVHFGH